MSQEDLCYTPATELSPLIRNKSLSPVELTKAVLDRIDRLNPEINAFCTVTHELALAQLTRIPNTHVPLVARLQPLQHAALVVECQ